DRHIERAARHAEESGVPADRARDVGAVAGLALTMLGVRALKILPNLPFAPGHKLVLLTPLYVVATRTTRTRVGASATGLTMGVVSFLMGDGKYGPFEIVKHVAPGVMCDALLPWLAPPSRQLGPVAWSLLGGLIAAGRFASIFVIALLVQTPAVAIAFLLPGLTIHMTFGFLSGYITWQLLRARAAAGADAEVGAGPPKDPDSRADAPLDPLREPREETP
ncbi:MAG: hypothetical protein WKG00_11620, partial [Polyangiaceae bacterium]